MNFRNRRIKLYNVEQILQQANIDTTAIKPSNIDIYQKSFVHKSYVERNQLITTTLKQYYRYSNPLLLLETQPESYECLEFFGDSIVSAATVEYLYLRYADTYDEGSLTKLKNKLVSSSYLSKFAKYFQLNQWLVLSNQMENLYGRNVDRLLEDVFESFVATISLDINYQVAKEFVVFCLENLVDFAQLISSDENYKDRILNQFQLHGLNYPQYSVDTELGPQNKKTFVVNIFSNNASSKSSDMGGSSIVSIASGVGKTKKEAEMNASFNALQKITI